MQVNMLNTKTGKSVVYDSIMEIDTHVVDNTIKLYILKNSNNIELVLQADVHKLVKVKGT